MTLLENREVVGYLGQAESSNTFTRPIFLRI